MLKAILADLDGTLVYSAQANAAAYAAALAEVGIEADPVRLAPAIDGRSWRDFLPDLVAHEPSIEAELVARRKRSLYPGYFHLLRPNDRLIDLVRTMHLTVKTALVTTASMEAVQGVMHRFALAELFDAVITGDHVANAKPAPDGYTMAAAMLGVQPSECLVLEDSDTGAEAARRFGGGLLRWHEA